MYDRDSGIDTLDDNDEWSKPFNDDLQNIRKHSTEDNVKKKGHRINEIDTYTSRLNHARTIIHIDIDCFYAQVEMIRNPQLRDKPLGIQQKHIVVTCNYKAREYGVTKLMTIKDAKEKCPQLILVNGEDLTHYREMSYKISEFLQKYTQYVERLGFDENFLDVTEIVQQRINLSSFENEVKGHIFTDDPKKVIQTVPCNCGCQQRLTIGSQIANDIRSALFDEKGITCCAGISYNKLLAKLVGEQHKPNQQTTLFPTQTPVFMASMKKARKIPGIGHTMSNKLARIGVNSVTDLQQIPLPELVSEIGDVHSLTVKQLSYGIDDNPIVPYGKPQTLSDEDSLRNCTTVAGVKSKSVQLLKSLLHRLQEDGRITQTVRLTIRKLTDENNWSNRESRQCPVPHHLALKISQGKTDGILQELEKLIMSLFTKLIDTSLPFHLTLMNIAFCNLTEIPKNSIQNFLSPNKSRNSGNNGCSEKVNMESVRDKSETENEKTSKGIKSFFSVKQSEIDKHQNNTRTEKKRKIDIAFAQHSSKKAKLENASGNTVSVHSVIDKEVFDQLPLDIQQEVLHNSQSTTNENKTNTANQSSKYAESIDSNTRSQVNENEDLKKKLHMFGINPEDFFTFPQEVQKDILEQYKITSTKPVTEQQNKKSILNYFTAKNK